MTFQRFARPAKPIPVRQGRTPRDISAEVGRRIQDRRLALGMSQRDLCGAVGFHATVITKIETGQRKVSVDDLVAIAGALGVEPAALLPQRGAERVSGPSPRGDERLPEQVPEDWLP